MDDGVRRTPTRHRRLSLAALGLVGLIAIGLAALLSSDLKRWAQRLLRFSPSPTAIVQVVFPDGVRPALNRIEFSPRSAVKTARMDRGHRLWIETDGRAFQVRAPEVCPLEIPPVPAGNYLQRAASARVDFGPSHIAQVGYDSQVEVVARLGCPNDMGEVRVHWSQQGGPKLQQIQALDRGHRLRVHTLPLKHFFQFPLQAGVIAVSPRTQGRYVFEAQVHAPPAAPFKRTIVITSHARSNGLSSIAVSQKVLLGGDAWTLRSAPPRSRAATEVLDGVTIFQADRAGRYVLADLKGHTLELHAQSHERTPLDCGRAECHPNETSAARGTAMSETLKRVRGSATVPTCAFECHVVGEPGLPDGGFLDVGRGLGFKALEDTPVAELPTALRRLAGVGCTSCHGPSAIPPPATRARILRADVCATCHDAPPRYTHVAQWRTSRMAQSDHDVRTRTAVCARCHTTGGFLNALGVRPRKDLSRAPDDQGVGIACAACHAPHGAHRANGLLRATQAAPSLAAPKWLNLAPSALCTRCHAPLPEESHPSASSAAIWLGRVRMPQALGGSIIEGPAPHAALPGGCMACHGASPDSLRRTTHHGFGVNRAICAGCHDKIGTPWATSSELNEQASRLLAELNAACEAQPLPLQDDSHPASPIPSCRTSQNAAQARYSLSLVKEDPAAGIHNRPFVQQLLEEGRRALLTP